MNQQELQQVFVLANRFKEGDLPVGGTADERLSEEARAALSALRLGEIVKTDLVEDGVTEALRRALDPEIAPRLYGLTVAGLKNILLGGAGPGWLQQHRDGLSSEVIAAVAKIMSGEELSRVARSVFNPLPGDGVTIGSPLHLGSRIQPNSPGDDEEEILFSILEGLAYGCGDVIIGLNPASDDVETIVRLEELLGRVVDSLGLPTRYCVLSDMVKQTTARARTRVDVGFQSLAGTSAALMGMLGLDVDAIADLARGFSGVYFETGQGSEVTNGAAQGADMVTLESRTYGVARAIRRQITSQDGKEKWMIVNDVAGFIGPEVFRTGDQLRRACLEDTVMAKLHGITMGLDVCATFHMGIEPSLLRRLTEEIAELAAPAYLMAVAGNADPMLGYMTTSFREHPELRRRGGKQITSAMQDRLKKLGIPDGGRPDPGRIPLLYAGYAKAGGDKRPVGSLIDRGAEILAALGGRGFDLGGQPSDLADRRMEAMYAHARQALYAKLNEAVIRDVAPSHLRVRTEARDRDDYLLHPRAGERVCGEDAGRISALYQSHRPGIQIVISDGLNANSTNENLRELLPLLAGLLAKANHNVGEVHIVIDNARVRAGYHVGALLDPDVVIHLIGERPGTGINTLSAYLTYGRDRAGQSRWSVDLDHSNTTAICGIHRRGKHPSLAAEEIARATNRILDERRSGVALGSSEREQ